MAFINISWRISSTFCWGHLPRIPLFWTSNDICPGFQNQDGSPCLHASLPVCNEFLKFTIAATPADLLVVSMAAEPFFDQNTCTLTSIGGALFRDRAYHCLTACGKTF